MVEIFIAKSARTHTAYKYCKPDVVVVHQSNGALRVGWGLWDFALDLLSSIFSFSKIRYQYRSQ